jgi:FlaA1/EpsC-like NDP-sugar epimerase
MGSVSLTKAANQALLTLGVYTLFMFLFQSYSGLIRHTTIKDIYRIFLATTSSTLALIFLSLAGREFYWTQVFIIPISILIIHYVVITVMLSFIRIIINIFESFKYHRTARRIRDINRDTGVAVKRIIKRPLRRIRDNVWT